MKMMMLILVLVFGAMSACWAGSFEGMPGIELGYRGVDVNSSFTHTTHPADSGWMPGNPGSTDIGFCSYLAIGPVFQEPIGDSVALRAGLGAMLGLSRDQHQNDNDGRGPNNGSFVYSKSLWGFYGHADLLFALGDSWYIGAEGQVMGVSVDHGWYRWGTDESESSEFMWIPTIGPKIGIRNENVFLEATTQFSGDRFGANLMLGFLL